jgi:hypothetical protein
VDNSFGMASQILDTHVSSCEFDGSMNTTSTVGGATVRYGSVRGCRFRRFRRTAIGFSGADGHLVVEGNRSEYLAADFDGGPGEDTFVYSDTTSGTLIVRGNVANSRQQTIRAEGTLTSLIFENNECARHNAGAFGTTFPVRVSSATVAEEVRIRNNKFNIPTGSADNGIVMLVNADTNYIIENNDVSGWSRTRVNWYLQGAGTGTINFGAGNRRPGGEFGREVDWEDPIWIGGFTQWIDGAGNLRINSGAPSSDTDGTVVGTQT